VTAISFPALHDFRNSTAPWVINRLRLLCFWQEQNADKDEYGALEFKD